MITKQTKPTQNKSTKNLYTKLRTETTQNNPTKPLSFETQSREEVRKLLTKKYLHKS